LWFSLPDQPPAGSLPSQISAQTPALPVPVDGHPLLLPIETDTPRADGLSSLNDLSGTGHHSAPGDSGIIPMSRRVLLSRWIDANALPALDLDQLQHVAAALDDAHRYLDGSVVGTLDTSAAAAVPEALLRMPSILRRDPATLTPASVNPTTDPSRVSVGIVQGGSNML